MPARKTVATKGARTNTAPKRDTVASLRNELKEYKEQVRQVTLAIKDESGACDDGVNDFLERVGLSPTSATFVLSLVLTKDVEVFPKDDPFVLASDWSKEMQALGYRVFDFDIEEKCDAH